MSQKLIEMEAAEAFKNIKGMDPAAMPEDPQPTFKQNEGTETVSELAAEVAAMDLSAFLPDAANRRISETKQFPAPPGFPNKDGSRATVILRKLSFVEIADMSELYRKSEIIRNKKGRVETTTTGRAAVTQEVDGNRLTDAMIAKSLVFPNLSSRELLSAYNCLDELQLVRKIFNRPADYTYMARIVSEYSGIGLMDDEEGESAEELMVKQAKNS